MFFYFLFFTFYFFSCQKNGTALNTSEFGLTAESVEVTEVWLTLHSGQINNDDVYTVTRNDSLVFKGRLDKSDSLLHDENLQPDTDYTYRLVRENSIEKQKAEALSITTMDTTSHDFTWETFEFGETSHSILRDVGVISENDI